MSRADSPVTPRAPSTDRSTRLYGAAVALLLLMGTLLRVAGYFGGIELWWDEAMWAMFIMENTASSIRPLGYIQVSRWLLELHNTEAVIRSVSLGAGVLSLPVFLALCRRAGLSRLASLFGLFVLAAHPAAIDLTKEFKPYALELFLHLLLLWLAFAYLGSPSTWRLVLVSLAAIVAAPFSWSIVVLYPGLFATLALSTFRRRSPRQMASTVVGALATLGAVLVHYTVQYQIREPRTAYWGEKYDVFYLGSDLLGRAAWILERTYDLASLPARLESFWPGAWPMGVWAPLQAVLCLLGLIGIVTARRWDRAGLWVGPWVVAAGMNVAGWWPYGAFRTNLFLLAYSLLVSLAGLDGLRRWIASRPAATRYKTHLLVPASCAAFVLAFLPVDLGFFAEGKSSGMAGNCHAHRAFEVVYQAERDEAPPGEQRRFLVDHHAYDAYLYYRNFHVVARARYKDFLRERYRRSRRYQPLKQAVNRQLERGFWLLACDPSQAASLRPYVLDRCSEVDHLQDLPRGGLLLRCRGSAGPGR
jgi:hypothetical protein